MVRASVPQEERDRGGVGEFRGHAKSPVDGVVARMDLGKDLTFERVEPLDFVGPGAAHPLERSLDRLRVLGDLFRLFAPEPRDLLQDATKSGSAVTVRRGEVRAPQEHFTGGRQERRERPAAFPGERPHLSLVATIHFGVLVPVDLDRDEILGEQARDLRVDVRPLVHDVAPVAPGGSDVEQDRAAGPLGELERFGAPRMPVDRLFGGAAEVRRAAFRQSTRSAGFTRLGHDIRRFHDADTVGGRCARALEGDATGCNPLTEA